MNLYRVCDVFDIIIIFLTPLSVELMLASNPQPMVDVEVLNHLSKPHLLYAFDIEF